MKYGYGCLGFLALLGILGIVTEERSFLAFFGFAVDFQYFFRKPDEMMIDYMNKSAARAFMCGMLITAVVTLIYAALYGINRALLIGIAWGWSASVLVYALSTAWYGIKESWWTGDD